MTDIHGRHRNDSLKNVRYCWQLCFDKSLVQQEEFIRNRSGNNYERCLCNAELCSGPCGVNTAGQLWKVANPYLHCGQDTHLMHN